MSMRRMQDVLNELERHGWKLIEVNGEVAQLGRPFTPEREVTAWTIANPGFETTHHLEFHLFGQLGEQTDNVDDILYCKSKELGFKLYFDKENSKSWNENLVTFVRALGDSAQKKPK